MNAKQAYETMMAARAAALDAKMVKPLDAIVAAVRKGEPDVAYFGKMDSCVIDELRRRKFVVIEEDGMNETWIRISWPKPEGRE